MTQVDPASAGSPRQVMRAVGSNALARMITLPLGAVLGIVITRLLIDNYGEATYAQYTLLVGIGALIPFADLGVTAAIMNVTAEAEDPRHDVRLRRTLVTCVRLLLLSGAVTVTVAIVLLITGAWPAILGKGLLPGTGPVAASLVLAVFGVSLVVSFGQRLLGGLGLLHWNVLLAGLQTPLVLAVLLIAIELDVAIGDYLAVVAYVATLLIGVLTLWLANRRVSPTVRHALAEARMLRRVRGEPVFDTAWPMLVQMVALPLAMQTDRVVLSQVGTISDLAQYSLAAQMFNPLVGVVSVAGLALWPIYAKARSGHGATPSPFALSGVFLVVGASFAGVVAAASPLLADLASGGVIVLSPGLVLAFSAVVVLQATKYPVGMYLTDGPGLRFQAVMILMMLPTKLALSIWLARDLGAVGPVIGTVIAVLIFQVLANMGYARHRLSRADRDARFVERDSKP